MEDQGKAGSDSVLVRADALVRRRRQPASQSPQAEELPVLTEVVPTDTDLPLLLAEEEASSEALDEPEPASLDLAILDILAHELARRLQERLAAELPGLVEAALTGLSRELQQGLTATSEAAIRDFLAERARLAKHQQQR